ncbi:Sodium:neurotransmitter symporter family [Popillia japonica]|uniref:Sodium-dependent nutrient amino acid transporter 1 n=1 Tax=Popillia japonica TaxID=7064 RepID=A0AAW1LAF1_POPJA
MVSLQGISLTILTDSIPKCRPWMASLGTIIVLFCISLVYITNGGQFIFTLVDYFGGTMIFLILCIIETTAVFWWYGLENFCEDVEFMLKRKVGMYWRICWAVVSPLVLLAIFLYFVLTMERLQYEERDFPNIALVCGWLLIAVGLLQIPLWWIYYIYHVRRIGIIEGLRRSVSSSKWGPANVNHLAQWVALKDEYRERKSVRQIHWFKQDYSSDDGGKRKKSTKDMFERSSKTKRTPDTKHEDEDRLGKIMEMKIDWEK